MKTFKEMLEFLCGIDDEVEEECKRDLLVCGYKPTGEKALGKYDIYARGDCVIWYNPLTDEIMDWQKSVS